MLNYLFDSPHCIMTTFDPLAVGGTYLDVRSRSVISAELDADIRALSAAKDVAEVPTKAVFESAIGILVLVRVSVSAPSSFRPLISNITRTG